MDQTVFHFSLYLRYRTYDDRTLKIISVEDGPRHVRV